MDILKVLGDTLVWISPAIIAVVSIVALLQLRIAKNDIRTRSKRESVCLAIEKCEMFAKEILPIYQNQFVNNQVATLLKKWSLKNKTFSPNSIEEEKDAKEWTENLRKNGLYVCGIDFLNRIEGFAMYYTNGAADENVAYPVIGSVFCITVQQFSPLLIELREHIIETTASGPYQNTVDLYVLWSSRQTHKKLQEEMDELSARMGETACATIKPIGTE